MPDIGHRIKHALKKNESALAETIVARIYEQRPELVDFSKRPDRKELSLQDVKYHLSYLGEAATADDVSLFVDYVEWVRVLFNGLKLPDQMLGFTLRCMRDTMEEFLDGDLAEGIFPYVNAGISHLTGPVSEPASHLEEGEPLADLAKKYLEALLGGDRRRASRLILDAAESNVPIKDLYLGVFQKTQYEIGRLWQTNRVSVAQEHFCTAASQLIISQLYPYIFSNEKTGKRLVAACVGGELHEIGIRMVADFFEMAGWDTYYIGANTPTNTILQTVAQKCPDVLGLSATIMYNKSTLEDLIKKVREKESCQNIKILVGGYPFIQSPGLWEKIGADGFAKDASEAVEKAAELVSCDPARQPECGEGALESD